ncbi:hypothetical protein CTheo_7133 [Ceratobasidium theobromae]|uniref:Uncharacterized protein n=1 Tax=Ceratobasidium theobromae TaxID=1582974 RepID=A0A5N5QCF5_9AGAM|nr:hypothetical protein CTheo_7133 [Ceratobasidium theobromae]
MSKCKVVAGGYQDSSDGPDDSGDSVKKTKVSLTYAPPGVSTSTKLAAKGYHLPIGPTLATAAVAPPIPKPKLKQVTNPQVPTPRQTPKLGSQELSSGSEQDAPVEHLKLDDLDLSCLEVSRSRIHSPHLGHSPGARPQ